MDLGPIILEPILVEKPWGGRRLAALGKPLPTRACYGESWELADLPNDAVHSAPVTRTVVASGPFAGTDLRSLIAELGADLLGSASSTRDGDFPLLVKYLDAAQHLSVQVHPDEEYVARHPETHLKTESWYVVDAEPDAVLYLGFRDGVTRADVERRLGSAELVDLLTPVPALPGGFHHLPAGIVHALGAGVLVAEPQTPSDTTFRLYDWTEEYDHPPRRLQLDDGLEAMRLDARPRSLAPLEQDGWRQLVAGPAYGVVEHRSSAGTVEPDPRAELRILMVLRGELLLSASTGVDRLAAGTTILLPAATMASGVRLDVTAPATVLELSLTSIGSEDR